KGGRAMSEHDMNFEPFAQPSNPSEPDQAEPTRSPDEAERADESARADEGARGDWNDPSQPETPAFGEAHEFHEAQPVHEVQTIHDAQTFHDPEALGETPVLPIDSSLILSTEPPFEQPQPAVAEPSAIEHIHPDVQAAAEIVEKEE